MKAFIGLVCGPAANVPPILGFPHASFYEHSIARVFSAEEGRNSRQRTAGPPLCCSEFPAARLMGTQPLLKQNTHTQTHTDAHRHTDTQRDTHTHTHTHTHTDTDRESLIVLPKQMNK